MAEYPYDNLKGYLNDRELKNLSKHVDWENIDNATINDLIEDEYVSLKTGRSRSKICNMKLYIKHTSPKDYGFLLKTEAHIRFMNAIWFANKYLFAITVVVAIISAALLVFISAILYFGLFSRLKQVIDSDIYNFIAAFNNTVKSIIGTAFKTTFEWKDLLSTLCFMILISCAYMWVARIIVKTIKSNFHYQRIREIVSIIYIYDMLKKKTDKEDLESTREIEHADSQS